MTPPRDSRPSLPSQHDRHDRHDQRDRPDQHEQHDPRSWADRGYALLLRAYPPAYRARFGEAMRETFARDHARVRTAGRVRLLPFWLVSIAQALWFGAGERARALGARAGAGTPVPDKRSSRAIVLRAAGARAATSRGAAPHERTHGVRWSPLTDARLALRLLARSPLFTATAVVSLAVGLAASTTIAGLADALFLQPAPGVRGADRIVDLERTMKGRGYGTMSYALFRHLRERSQTFDALSATSRSPVPLSLRAGDGSERAYGLTVSDSYFDVLGAKPALGRFFRPDEDAVPDARPVVVLSHRYWREQFHGDAGVLDRPIRLNGTAFDVIGVAEPAFEGPTFIGADLWLPMAMYGIVQGRPGAEVFADGGAHVFRRAVGRLRPGVTIEAAQAEMHALVEAFRRETKAIPEGYAILLYPSGRLPAVMRTAFAGFVGLLLVVTGGLLLIACSNVAGMLLARATTRRREMATRLAMGASRGQLVGQLIVETLVLFALAGIVALPLTIWLTRASQAFLPSMPLPLRAELPISGRTLLFALAATLGTGLIFGLAPARHALRTDLAHMLHGRAATDGRSRQRLRQGLVAAQVALSLAMVITAGLFVRTLHSVSRLDAGFRTEGVEVVTLDTTSVRAVGAESASLMRRVEDRLRLIGGVDAVGYASQIPLQGGSFDLGGIRIPGAGPDVAARMEEADWDVASPDYFRAVGLPLRAGRAFTREDGAGRPLVAVVNETFARIAWPGQAAVGRQFWQTRGGGDADRPIEIVGVVKDAKYRSFDEPPRPFVYVPFDQHPQTGVEWFIRHTPGPSIAGEVRAAIAAAEPGLPVVMMQPFEEAIAIGMLPQRVAAWLAGVVGAIGLFLAALGLYGLAALLVAQRRREIAIRMALGAAPRDVRALVLGQAARLGLAGAGAGLLAAAGLGQFIASQRLLVGVDPIDPPTFAGVALVMGLVLLAASYLPARGAVSTDPATALRAP